jgi:quercetin dioxygenase-like cupin family protein
MGELILPGGVHAEIKVAGSETGGAFMLMSDRAPAGWHLPPHRHLRESETIHVTSGALAMRVGDHETVLGPGDTIHIPAGTLHSGATQGDQEVFRIVVFSPSGLETFFERLSQPGLRPNAMASLAEAHGWRFS